MEQMKSLDKIDVLFLKRISSVLNIPVGSNFTWTPSNLSSRPRLVIIGFKNSDASYTNNNSMFIQEKDGKIITSLQVELKNVFYPITSMNFDILKNKNVFPYSYYIEICKIFGNKPQLDLMDFMKI